MHPGVEGTSLHVPAVVEESDTARFICMTASPMALPRSGVATTSAITDPINTCKRGHTCHVSATLVSSCLVFKLHLWLEPSIEG